MDRRRFLLASLAGALAAPLGAGAQQPGKVYRIGFVAIANAPSPLLETIRHGLRELGWIDGQNIVIDDRYPEGRNERIPDLLADLIRNRVDVIVTVGTPATVAAKRATSTIPIVMFAVGDPVGSGLVMSLARPAGNVTGLGGLGTGMHSKMISLLKEAVPAAVRFGAVWNPTLVLHSAYLTELESAAQALAVNLKRFEVTQSRDLDSVFATMAADRRDAVVVLGQPLIYIHRVRIAELAREHKLPAIYVFREVAHVGGLMSYGSDVSDARRTAHYIDKILKGAKPGDLPVEQPTKFELVINLKPAKALGLTIPPSVLLRADQVIE